MKKLIYYIGIASIFFASCKKEVIEAETPTSSGIKIYGNGAGDDGRLFKLKEGYAIFGNVEGQGAGAMDISVIRLDENFNVLWRIYLGGAKNEYVVDLIETDDGRLIVAGSTYSYGNSTIQGNPSRSDIYVVCIDPNGKILWEKTYGESGSGTGREYDNVYKMIYTKDGNLLLAGNAGPASTPYVYLLKINTSGEKIWSENLVGYNQANAVVEDNEGNYFFCLNMTDSATKLTCPALGKYSNTGQKIFTAQLKSGLGLIYTQLDLLSDGSLLFTSNVYQASSSIEKTQFIKVSPHGSELWSNTINRIGVYELEYLSDGNFLLVGCEADTAQTILNPMLAYLSSDGQLLSKKVFAYRGKSSFNSFVQKDNRLLLLLSAKRKGSWYTDIYLLQTDLQGNIIPQ